MNPLVLTALFEALGKLSDRIFPDPAQKAAAQLELIKMQQAGEFRQMDADLQIASAQSVTDQAEAAAPDFFTRGWRPFVGWVCGMGLAYQFLARPLLVGVLARDFPTLETDTLLTLLFGMLGLGAYRTVEKIRGASK